MLHFTYVACVHFLHSYLTCTYPHPTLHPYLSSPLPLLSLLPLPAHVAALVVCPTEVLQVSMRDFVFHFVFNQDLPEEADDSWEAQEKIAQALLARRKMLSGFLKLVMYRNVDLIHAAPIFAQYMRVSRSSQCTDGTWLESLDIGQTYLHTYLVLFCLQHTYVCTMVL